jgi:hypothetical protein
MVVARHVLPIQANTRQKKRPGISGVTPQWTLTPDKAPVITRISCGNKPAIDAAGNFRRAISPSLPSVADHDFDAR